VKGRDSADCHRDHLSSRQFYALAKHYAGKNDYVKKSVFKNTTTGLIKL